MLEAIDIEQVDDLFDEIPDRLINERLEQVPVGLDEMELRRLLRQRGDQDGGFVNFIGAGAYEHHIPAAVWQIATRGEFYSAYTPYQAEASQGTLQLLYEYQTMMASLTGMEVSNASLYDGASGLAEAVLMAVRAMPMANRILLPDSVHPAWREAVATIIGKQGITLSTLAHDPETGIIDVDSVAAACGDDVAALVIPQPNFLGCLESVDELTDLAHEHGWLVIAAFVFHVLSAFVTLAASPDQSGNTAYMLLYWGTFIFAVANGTLEAVANPLVATLFPNNRTHYLNILHASWPAGLVPASTIKHGC